MSHVEVHPLSHRPTAAWEELKQRQQVIKIKTKIPTKPPGDRKVKSGTHPGLEVRIAEAGVFLPIEP